MTNCDVVPHRMLVFALVTIRALGMNYLLLICGRRRCEASPWLHNGDKKRAPFRWVSVYKCRENFVWRRDFTPVLCGVLGPYIAGKHVRLLIFILGSLKTTVLDFGQSCEDIARDGLWQLYMWILLTAPVLCGVLDLYNAGKHVLLIFISGLLETTAPWFRPILQKHNQGQT